MVLVEILQGAKRAPQVHFLALVEMNIPVHLYCQLCLEFSFHKDVLVHENGCGDLRADMHTVDKIYFDLDVEDAND